MLEMKDFHEYYESCVSGQILSAGPQVCIHIQGTTSFSLTGSNSFFVVSTFVRHDVYFKIR